MLSSSSLGGSGSFPGRVCNSEVGVALFFRQQRHNHGLRGLRHAAGDFRILLRMRPETCVQASGRPVLGVQGRELPGKFARQQNTIRVKTIQNHIHV